MARIYYDVGKYDSALHLLNCVHFVAGEEQLHLSYMWGKLNCELILGCFDESRDTLKSLKNKLDADHLFGGTHSFYQVYSRTQYIHALLYFVYFNDKSVDSDFDMFMEIVGSENYFAVIQMVAPYFIRYLISSPLLSRNYFTYGTYGVNWLLNALQ